METNHFQALIQELKALGATKVNIEIQFDNSGTLEISPGVETTKEPQEPEKPKIEIPKEMLEEEF